MAAVAADGLVKCFSGVVALAGLNIEVQRGTLHGLLGVNGAGKTTAVRVWTTVLHPDAGTATVGGFDVVRDAHRVRQLIGVTGQVTALDQELTGRANLYLFGRLAGQGRAEAKRRSAELIDRFEIGRYADRAVWTYSGGMRRRIDIASALMKPPEVLFLDEPSAGLDALGRNALWQLLRQLRADGTTMLLATHYLDEADQMADSLSIMHAGQVIASGSPTELKQLLKRDVLDIYLGAGMPFDELCAEFGSATGLRPTDFDADPLSRRLSVATGHPLSTLKMVADALDSSQIPVESINLRHPSLDEVFLDITGRAEPGVVDEP